MEGLSPLHRRVAGIDVHRMLHVVTVLIEQPDGSVAKHSREFGGFNRLLKYPTQKCGTLLGTFDFHATLSHSELPVLFEADFIGLSLVFPHFPRLTLSAHGFAPACAYA